MASLHPYLNFNGNCEEAFNYYQSLFGGSFEMVMRFKEVPAEYPMPPRDGEKIMHIALPIGNGSMLMGSDVPSNMEQAKTGSNFHISINAQSKEEADHLFNGLSAGGSVMMPLEQAFWGDYFGMLTDRFGVNWMMSFNEKYQS